MSESWLSRDPDVEAVITLWAPAQGGRSTLALSGYRPGHRIREDYITSGMHQYPAGELAPGSMCLGTITFLGPVVYPHSLWVGREIDIMEGSRVIGLARITQIFNALLSRPDCPTLEPGESL